MGWEAVGVIGSLIGAIAGAVSALNPPKVSIPKVEIPKEDMDKINASIESNKGMSDAARANIEQALTMYQQGKLTPQYQAQLDDWWNKQTTALQQRLASMGLSNSTMAQSALNELNTAYLSNMGNLLQKQLSDALSMAGLADDYKNSLMSKAQLELQGKIAEAESYMQAQAYSASMGQAAGQTYGNLSSAFSKLGTSEKQSDKKTTTPTTTTTSDFGEGFGTTMYK